MENKEQRTARHKRLWFLASIAVVVSAVIAIAMASNMNKLKTEIDAQTRKDISAIANPVPVDPAVLEADKKRLTVLKTKFNYKYDEFEKIGWYENKNQTSENSWNRKLLRVLVNSEGYAYLEDRYYGDDWIFHTYAKVIVGGETYESTSISITDSNNSEYNGSGSVWERISYTGGRDNGIIKAIAESGDNAVKVRFVGNQSVSDFVLADRDQQAIKDAYELSELIKKIGTNN